MLTTHLRQIEAEATHLVREVAAEFRAPVRLYSRISERNGVAIRFDEASSIERRKQEGYF